MTLKPDTTNNVIGRIVIVTGGGTGIGRSYAKHFAANGAIPIIAEIDIEAGENVAREIESDGGQAMAIQTDVSDEDSVAAMIAGVMKKFDRIDVLINNAAIFSTVRRSRFEDISRDDWTKMLDVNVIGSWMCAKLAVPHMENGGYGRIINISSSTVPVGLPLLMHYVTSKAAIVGMTRCMASELGERGITCNAILPGMTDSEVEYIGRTEESLNGVMSMQKIKRFEQTDDLVGIVLFIASPASGFMTGQSIIVDGGMAYS
ncbi:MAG: SDR family oxidoreductase [Pseudomonadota bacterium]|nr:SDR family oxidoreductase [Pseudomonadota bacterium]